MEGVGWIGAIIIGGLAGWIAQAITGANTNLWLNIILGILGAIIANARRTRTRLARTRQTRMSRQSTGVASAS